VLLNLEKFLFRCRFYHVPDPEERVEPGSRNAEKQDDGYPDGLERAEFRHIRAHQNCQQDIQERHYYHEERDAYGKQLRVAGHETARLHEPVILHAKAPGHEPAGTALRSGHHFLFHATHSLMAGHAASFRRAAGPGHHLLHAVAADWSGVRFVLGKGNAGERQR